MGWVIALILAAVSFGGLWLSRRCSRMALEIAAAAVLIGLTGYAWQGSPDLPGQPANAPIHAEQGSGLID